MGHTGPDVWLANEEHGRQQRDDKRNLNEKARLPVIGSHEQSVSVYHIHNCDCRNHKHPEDGENDKSESQDLIISKEFHLFQHTLALLCIWTNSLHHIVHTPFDLMNKEQRTDCKEIHSSPSAANSPEEPKA